MHVPQRCELQNRCTGGQDGPNPLPTAPPGLFGHRTDMVHCDPGRKMHLARPITIARGSNTS